MVRNVTFPMSKNLSCQGMKLTKRQVLKSHLITHVVQIIQRRCRHVSVIVDRCRQLPGRVESRKRVIQLAQRTDFETGSLTC